MPEGHKETQLPQRNIETRNNLMEEIITVTSVHKFKEILNEKRNRDGTTPD